MDVFQGLLHGRFRGCSMDVFRVLQPLAPGPCAGSRRRPAPGRNAFAEQKNYRRFGQILPIIIGLDTMAFTSNPEPPRPAFS